jgi:peptidoglycan/xylan/chitin deacetylase (PgdA/CDA1 family)
MSLRLSLRAKGARGVARRVGTVTARFGTTSAAMARSLEHYAGLVDAFGARPSLPITATVLARHPGLVRRFAERGVEFAIHGLVHDDHAALDLHEQRARLAKAKAIFEAAGVAYAGFRGPYLRANAATTEAVRAANLRYDSTRAVAFPVLAPEIEHGPRGAAWRRALDFYAASRASESVTRPTLRGGVVELPVAVPDDETMVDRLHLSADGQAAAWLAILELTYARGELFTLQLHPERIADCAPALCAVLAQARRAQPPVWMATLDEIASWWLRRQRVRFHVEQVAPQRYRCALGDDADATLLARGLTGVDARPWVGRDWLVRARSFEFQSDVKPVVGVSRRCPPAVLAFLRDEGLPVELDHQGARGRYGAYVDGEAGAAATAPDQVRLLAHVEQSPGPLLRFWRWPRGARSALAVTGDVDAVTIQDFVFRQWETRRRWAERRD